MVNRMVCLLITCNTVSPQISITVGLSQNDPTSPSTWLCSLDFLFYQNVSITPSKSDYYPIFFELVARVIFFNTIEMRFLTPKNDKMLLLWNKAKRTISEWKSYISKEGVSKQPFWHSPMPVGNDPHYYGDLWECDSTNGLNNFFCKKQSFFCNRLVDKT